MILRFSIKKTQIFRSEDDLSTETFAQGGQGLSSAISCFTVDVDVRANKQTMASEGLFY